MSKNSNHISKAARLFIIIKFLLDDETIIEKELTKLFEIDNRTFYRDMKSIRELGIPIIVEDGRYKIDFVNWNYKECLIHS